MYSDSAYVAYGVDEETTGEPRYWVAVWDDDGPQSEESFCETEGQAARHAKAIAKMHGLEAWKCDEFGAVAPA